MTEKTKATFGAEEQKETVVLEKREELAVAWKRTDKNGDDYISVKVKLDSIRELNFKAFKNKRKKEGDAKPDYVAFKDTQKTTDK